MNLLKRNLVVILLLAVALILMANKLILWGLAALAASLIIFGFQQLIQLNVKASRFEDSINGLEEKNKALEKMNERLSKENAFLMERHFQITQIKSILELNLFEIDTKFKRSVKRQETKGDREIKYLGSLSVSLNAKYGIDCKELRFKYIPDSDELIVANINPKFLSFGNRKLEWEFFEVLEFRKQNPLAERRWMTSNDLSEYAEKVKEGIRLDTERSLENGPEEFYWIKDPIRENVENVIKILFGRICSNIRIAERADDSFVVIEKIPLDNLTSQGKESRSLPT